LYYQNATGFLLGKPDDTGNPELLKIARSTKNPNDIISIPTGKGWGSILTPDEFRLIYAMGNSKLVTSSGQYFTDEMLKAWIDQTAFAVSQDLQHEIYPRLFRHRGVNNEPREIEDYANWDDPYDYENSKIGNLFYIRTRHFPLISVLNWNFVNPVSGGSMIDMLPQMRAKNSTGELRNTGIMAGLWQLNNAGTHALRSTKFFNAWTPTKIPGCFYIDYVTGYDHSNRVPHDLKELIAKVLTIKVMSAFGDGIAGRISNFSISVGALSESIGTAMGSSSTYFGARITQLQDEIKDWIAGPGQKYKPVRMALL
jgi:hypothetical protein